MIFKDYYKILDLENNKVNIDEIKLAFREQAKKYHPDVNIGNMSEERFKDINEAYKILSNINSKRKYDRIWYSHVGKRIEKSNSNNNRETKTNFLGILFGSSKLNEEPKNNRKNKIAVKGENIDTEINISLEQAFYGADKKILLRAIDGKMKSFSVKVPAGIRNGEKIRLIGQGKQGQNGGKNGDLLIKVKIDNNKKYRLKGFDIHTDLLITPWEAALGARVEINGIDDSANIYIPQGIVSGEKIRLPGKGYRDGKGGRGDLVAEIKIVIPKKPSEEEIKLFKELNEISKFEPRKDTVNIN